MRRQTNLSLIFLALLLCGCGGSGGAGSNSSQQSSDEPTSSVFPFFQGWSESIYDGDGSWGRTHYGYRMALRDSYWRADVYGFLAARNDLPAVVYAQRADAVLQYLLTVQSQGGTGVFGFPADVANPEFGSRVQQAIDTCPSCIHNGWIISLPGSDIAELYYDHGYALVSLVRAYERTHDASLLSPMTSAADWILDKPLTTNINYLSALSKGLCYAYRATGDSRYLDRAVELHVQGILPFLNENGEATDAHNARLEYHGFIVSGLIALRQSLPADHALIAQLDQTLAAAVARMASRDLQENGDYGVTWPGTNLLAWYELSLYRPLSSEEKVAVARILALIEGYVDDIGSETDPYRFQKALYSNFFVGFYAR